MMSLMDDPKQDTKTPASLLRKGKLQKTNDSNPTTRGGRGVKKKWNNGVMTLMNVPKKDT